LLVAIFSCAFPSFLDRDEPQNRATGGGGGLLDPNECDSKRRNFRSTIFEFKLANRIIASLHAGQIMYAIRQSVKGHPIRSSLVPISKPSSAAATPAVSLVPHRPAGRRYTAGLCGEGCEDQRSR
jgi:hypothetical protein